MIAFLDEPATRYIAAPNPSERTAQLRGDHHHDHPGEYTRPLPLIGQAVGQAQASLTRLLTGVLAGIGD